MSATSPSMGDDEVEALASASDATVRRLATEVRHLRSLIRAHAAKRGHELCWLNDLALWKAVGVEGGYPHDSLPVRAEFLAQCQRYYTARLTGSPYEEPATALPVVPPGR